MLTREDVEKYSASLPERCRPEEFPDRYPDILKLFLMEEIIMDKYCEGMSHEIRFGGISGEFGVIFYGDTNHPAAGYAMAADTAEIPDQAVLADHQKLRFWFRFGVRPQSVVRPYGEVCQLADELAAKLEAVGWAAAPAIEDYPDTRSSVDDLVDTDSFEYWGKPEAEFPRQPSAHGYNAAGGFTLVAEKLGTQPVFSADEIEAIRQLALECGRQVYGRGPEAEEESNA